MPETVMTAEACNACGADVRDESIFCYNCGERVRNEEPFVETAAVAENSSAVVENSSAVAVSRPPLRSAASLRKQRRAYNRQPVEFTWEPADRPPVGFVITTIVLVFGSLVLLLLALYLR